MKINIETYNEDSVKVYPGEYLGNKFWEFKDILTKYNGRYVTEAGSKYNVVVNSKAPSLQQELANAGFTVFLEEELANTLKGVYLQIQDERASIAKALDEADKLLAKRGLSIRSYQREDTIRAYLERIFMICNPVGTGKTMTSLLSVPKGYKTIIVSPAGVRWNWRDEVVKWDLGEEGDVYVATSRQDDYSFHKPFTVLTYSTLPPKEKAEDLVLDSKTALILDEVHMIKNNGTKKKPVVRTEKTKALIDAVHRAGGMILGLTATPLLNKPQELFNILRSMKLMQKSFGSWNGFTRLFRGYQTQYGWEFKGPVEQVPEVLSKVMVKRERSTIIDELPDYSHQVLNFTLDRKIYRQITEEIAKVADDPGVVIKQALEEKNSTAFEALSRCRAILSQAKAVQLQEEVESYIESEEPVVVCSCSSQAIKLLAEKLPKGSYGVITGEVTPTSREDIRKRFMAGEFPVLLCTIGSCYQGVDFTRASHMLKIDQDFRPGINYQMRGRIDRLTQTSKALVYKYAVTDHPIDVLIHQILSQKSDLIEGTFGFKEE